jgi:hypothetical protein
VFFFLLIKVDRCTGHDEAWREASACSEEYSMEGHE